MLAWQNLGYFIKLIAYRTFNKVSEVGEANITTSSHFELNEKNSAQKPDSLVQLFDYLSTYLVSIKVFWLFISLESRLKQMVHKILE